MLTKDELKYFCNAIVDGIPEEEYDFECIVDPKPIFAGYKIENGEKIETYKSGGELLLHIRFQSIEANLDKLDSKLDSISNLLDALDIEIAEIKKIQDEKDLKTDGN